MYQRVFCNMQVPMFFMLVKVYITDFNTFCILREGFKLEGNHFTLRYCTVWQRFLPVLVFIVMGMAGVYN